MLKAKFHTLRKVHYITDSPASQYRNRSVLHMIGQHSQEFGIAATWHYLESSHGKGPCDGVGGMTVKKVVEEELKKGKIMSMAEQFCQSFKKLNSKIRVILLPASEVTECRKQVNRWKVSQVKSISQCLVHSETLFMKGTSRPSS